MMRFNIKWSLLILTFLLTSQCAKKSSLSIQNNPEAYKNYILAYSSGLLKRNEQFRIEFSKPVIAIDKVNQAVDPSWFNITPALKGSCNWTSINSLEFIPDKTDLKANRDYEFNLDLSYLFPEIDKSIKNISIGFSYVPISLNYSWLFPRPEPVENNAMYLSGTIETNDHIDPSKLIEAVKAHVGPDHLELKPEISTNPSNPFKYDIIIRHIPKSTQSTELNLEWDESFGQENSSITSTKIRIPGIDDFEVTGVDEALVDDNLLTIYFSNILNASQDVRGLLRFKDDSTNLEINKEKILFKFVFQIIGKNGRRISC